MKMKFLLNICLSVFLIQSSHANGPKFKNFGKIIKDEPTHSHVRHKRDMPAMVGWHLPMNPVQNDGPPVTNLRSVYCDPELNVGKRDLVGRVDSFPELSEFFLRDDNSDIKFNIRGVEIPAHKFVLAAKSERFADIMKEQIENKTIDLNIESIDAFKVMLKYFYSEKLIMENETDYKMAFEVFKLAEKYQITRLMSIVEHSLSRMITLDNYIEIQKFANSHRMNELLKAWTGFVFGTTPAIISDEKYLNESIDIIEKILFSLNTDQRYVILTIKKLLEKNPESDKEQFKKLIFIFKCTVDDLLVLREMGMFDDKLLIEEIVGRFRVLHANCNDRLQRRVVPFGP